MKPVIALSFAAALGIGCATAHLSRVTPLACPEGGFGSVNRSDDGSLRPIPRGWFLPPMPPPADVRGHRLDARLVVDTTGLPMRDSITVCGLTNAAYSQRIAEALAKMPFEPARRDGVAVRAPVIISYVFR